MKQWEIAKSNDELKKSLSSKINISKTVAQILINRGLTNEDEALAFLSPSLKDLPDPALLPDMERGCKAIIEALEQSKKITIYGDYDVDGLTSTALLYKFLKQLNADVDYYIPSRLDEGYGLNKNAIKELKQRETSLIITVDNGSKATDEVAFANSIGVDVIITDHHEMEDEDPKALAHINPKRNNSKFPFKELAGVGVVFFLCIALRRELRKLQKFSEIEPDLKGMLDLVALGTIADIVPLIGINRILSKFGIEEIKKAHSLGIHALLNVSSTSPEDVTSQTIAFRLAPRINAAGRIGDQLLPLKLLITDNISEAIIIANKLNALNAKRQNMEAKIVREATKLIKDNNFADDPALIISAPNWHPGVIGIVASKLAGEYNKPAFIINEDEKKCRGSARGVAGFDVIEALHGSAKLLKRYGGHKNAAGFDLPLKNISKLRDALNNFTKSKLKEMRAANKLSIDAEVNGTEINQRLVSEINLLEPFGFKNPEPLFALKDAGILSSRIVGNGHLKMIVEKHDAIAFGMADKIPEMPKRADIAFVPQINTWQGVKNIQLKVMDIIDRRHESRD